MDTKVWVKVNGVDDSNYSLSRILEFANGARVEIPINQDGSVRWFDDSQLLRVK